MTEIARPNISSPDEWAEARRQRRSRDRRIGPLVAIALAFPLGIAASHAYGHYTRQSDCQRWQENVHRWAEVVDYASGELRPIETPVLALARGGMIAVRNQMCGF